MSRVDKKVVYRITFELKSPLAIGSGRNSNTDKDIILDGNGVPYIPGSAIAGVCRSLLGSEDAVWGYIEKATVEKNSAKSVESKLILYDAVIYEGFEPNQITIRDSVALDDYKVAKDGAKFDMEILEPGPKFVTFIEQSLSEGEENIAEQIAGLFSNNEVVFGGKSMRGYGEIDNVSVFKAEFDLNDKDSLRKWIDFDKYNEKDSCYQEKTSFDINLGKKITLSLVQNGGISIRKYTTDVEEGKSLPDFEQLTLADGHPTIPGTSWTGAFGHHMRQILGMKECDAQNNEKWTECFGCVSKDGSKRKSKIRFSESIINDADSKVLSRNAIDRFSGGTVDGALYTEKTFYNGKTELKISFEKDFLPDETLKKALAVSIADLNEGFMAVGGETSIGRGLFKVQNINGQTFSDSRDLYNKVLEILK